MCVCRVFLGKVCHTTQERAPSCLGQDQVQATVSSARPSRLKVSEGRGWNPGQGGRHNSEKRHFIPVWWEEGTQSDSKNLVNFHCLRKCEPIAGHTGLTEGNWLNGACRGGSLAHSGLPTLPLGHAGLRGCPTEPLRPGAIINSHIGLATKVGSQGNMAGSDPLAARGDEGL